MPDSAGAVFRAAGHDVTLLRERIAPNSPDPLVAAVAEANGAILVSLDADFRALAKRAGIGRRRFVTLSRIALTCRESRIPDRLTRAMSLIEHEWGYCKPQTDQRLFIEIGDNVIRTIRYAQAGGRWRREAKGRMAANRLYYGDNLEVLRDRAAFPDGSVDLIYLDPPFNSAATYNLLFRAPDGRGSESQLEAFEDTWHWGDAAEQAYSEVLTSAHSSARRWGPVHDTLLFYTKTDRYVWNVQYQPLPQDTADAWYNNVEPDTGRRFNRADLTAAGVRSGPSGQPWRGVDPSAKGRHWAIPGFVGLRATNAQDALDVLRRLDAFIGRSVLAARPC